MTETWGLQNILISVILHRWCYLCYISYCHMCHQLSWSMLCFISLFVCFWLHWVFADAQACLSCGQQGPLLVAVWGPLTAVSPLVAERWLQGACRWGSRAQLLPSMKNPLRPGLEPTSPVLTEGFLATGPPVKSFFFCFKLLVALYKKLRKLKFLSFVFAFLITISSTLLLFI